MDHFVTATANPSQDNRFNNTSLSAVNAIALAEGIPWEDAFRMLLDQGKRYGLLLTEPYCLPNLLKEAGYVRIPGFRRLNSYPALNDYLLNNYPGISRALVSTCQNRSSKKRFCAVRKNPGTKISFTALDIHEEERDIISLWLHYSEVGVPKPVPDAPRIYQEQTHPSHKGYLYYQPNPIKNYTGDCVIRAFSAVLNLSWEETMDLLAKSSNYRNTALNARSVFLSLASEYGFDSYSRIVENGRGLTGTEFCSRMTLRCNNGERFFVKVGNSHVAGIIPTVINGERQYAVADCWDCSSEKIGDYWIYRPNKREPEKPVPKRKKDIPALRTGSSLLHPIFGVGKIISVFEEEQRILLFFPNQGEKLLTFSWVLENCKSC